MVRQTYVPFCDGGENEITFLNGPKLLDEDDVKYFPRGCHVVPGYIKYKYF
jgi:hypothetical protein